MTDEASGQPIDDDLPDVTRYYDQEGIPLRKHPNFAGSMAEFAELVSKLKPHQCGWPDGSRMSQKGTPCKKNKMPGSRACIFHSGTKRARGRKSHVLARGEISRLEEFVPPEISSLIARAREDPELLSIRQDVALLDARRAILAGRLYTGESGSLWAALNKQWSALADANQKARQAREADDATAAEKWRTKAQEAISEIGRIIQQGHKDESSWKELIATTRDLVNMKGQEHTRLERLSQVIYAEDMMNMCAVLLRSVLEHVSDGQSRLKIAESFARVINPRGLTIPAASPVGVEVDLAQERQGAGNGG
jgi:hypothetical protein